MISDFHDGCKMAVTRVPSVRIMLLGLAMSRGVKMPIPVITTKPMYVPLLTELLNE